MFVSACWIVIVTFFLFSVLTDSNYLFKFNLQQHLLELMLFAYHLQPYFQDGATNKKMQIIIIAQWPNYNTIFYAN